jgi:hypothetical protein
MYAVAPVIERAVLLTPPVHTMSQAAKEAVKHLRGKTYAPPVVGVASVRLPTDPLILEGLLSSAKLPDQPDGEAFVAARTILSQPVYIAPLPDGEAAAPGRRLRQVALVAAVDVAGEVWIGVGRMGVEQSIGRKSWTHDAQIAVAWHGDFDAACDALEVLYVEAPSRAGLPKLPLAWWIGGGKGSEATVPSDWKIRIAGAGRVAGYDIEIFESVGSRLELPDRIANERPVCLIDWCAYTQGRAQAIVSRYQRDNSNRLYVPLDGVDTFDDALTLLRLELRNRALIPVTPQGECSDGPRTVEEAVKIAAQECNHLEFLDKAWSSSKKSEYPRPAQALEFLRVTNAVVDDWREGRIDGSGFAGAFARRGVSGYRPDISHTARNNYQEDYERKYNGKTVYLGPHIANGTGPIARILRIYWYVDLEAKKFVIGHVGCKLRDKSNP